MRADRPSERGSPSGVSVSRRAFVIAGGGALGGVVGAGPGAAAGGPAALVGATAPYLTAVREAADGYGAVRVRDASDREAAHDVRVSGRPEPTGDRLAPVGAVVDGAAALSTPDGTWREVLTRTDVRRRWADDAPVETWSETVPGGADPAGPPGVERSGQAPSTLVRGPRAYQYATGRGGVGYYEVDGDAVAGTGTDDDATPVVRVGYVHADRAAREDGRAVGFLERYRERTPPGVDAATAFLDPALEE